MKFETVGTLEAMTRLSFLLQEVQKGKIFRIAKHGKIIAELRACPSKRKTPQAGFAKGVFGKVSEDFDKPLAEFAEYVRWNCLSIPMR